MALDDKLPDLIVLNTVQELLDLLDNLDGCGIIVTDEELVEETIMERG